MSIFLNFLLSRQIEDDIDMSRSEYSKSPTPALAASTHHVPHIAQGRGPRKVASCHMIINSTRHLMQRDAKDLSYGKCTYDESESSVQPTQRCLAARRNFPRIAASKFCRRSSRH